MNPIKPQIRCLGDTVVCLGAATRRLGESFGHNHTPKLNSCLVKVPSRFHTGRAATAPIFSAPLPVTATLAIPSCHLPHAATIAVVTLVEWWSDPPASAGQEYGAQAPHSADAEHAQTGPTTLALQFGFRTEMGHGVRHDRQREGMCRRLQRCAPPG